MARRITLIFAVVLILIGALSLLRVVGVISFSVGGLVGALILVAIGGVILWQIVARPEVGDIETVAASIPLEDASGATIRISHGAGQLIADGSAGPGQLVEGSFEGGLDSSVDREGERLAVHMRLPAGVLPLLVSPGIWGRGKGLDWRFGLSREVPLSLHFEAGAADLRLDLTELQVTDVRLSTGASSTVLTLPAHAGHTRVDVEAGAASLKVRVPEGVAARIRVSGGMSSTSVDRSRFPRSGGVFSSPDFETAENRADIRVSNGVGSVTVR